VPTLLVAAIVLIVVGFVLVVIGSRIKPRSLDATEPPTIGQIIGIIAQGIFDAIRKITSAPSIGEKLEGLGTLMMYVGAGVFIAWLAVTLFGAQTSSTTTPSPSSGASATPS
jgi:hypothetical protein